GLQLFKPRQRPRPRPAPRGQRGGPGPALRPARRRGPRQLGHPGLRQRGPAPHVPVLRPLRLLTSVDPGGPRAPRGVDTIAGAPKMNFTFVVVLVAVGLFGSTLATLELGRRLGQRAEAHGHEGTGAGRGGPAVSGLRGLVIALTFSGAVDRLDSRRKLVAVEANAVGTAWLRLDLLPADTQPQLRDLFRRYLDTRLRRFRALSG